MVYQWRPGMKMYEARWEVRGECIYGHCMHAENEHEIVIEAERFILENPDLGIVIPPDATVSVKLCNIKPVSDHSGDGLDA